jgi:hypothetical protein
MTKLYVVVCAAIAFTACSDGDRTTKPGGVSFLSPDPLSDTISVRLSPEKLTAGAVAFARCPFNRAFGTTFDLIAVGGPDVHHLDQVTVRLLDGTHLGPSITFPQPLLSTMFGSTEVVGTRAFRFSPEFGCLAMHPRSMIVDAAFRHPRGRTRHFTLRGRF